MLRKERGEPKPAPGEGTTGDGKFAAVAEPGLTVAGSIDGDAQYDIVTGRGIGRNLEGDFATPMRLGESARR